MNQIISLPYYKNSAKLFAHFADHDWSIFLDSGYPSLNAGRYDILSAEPIATIVSRAGITTLTQASKQQSSKRSPFEILKVALKIHAPEKKHPDNSLPFNGGILGYFSYDLARTIENIPNIASNDENLPEMAVGIYTWAIIVDHKLKKTYFTGEVLKRNATLTLKILTNIFTPPPPPQSNEEFYVNSKVSSNFSYDEYHDAFDKIKEYIIAGDCYQVNLTQRFSATAKGNPWLAYQQLRKLNPAPFSAYINTPFGQILSSSPERFLQVNEKEVETKPIKGTRPRSNKATEDRRLMEELRKSPKDRSENVMIVDLIRNDLGRVCEVGSVKVSSLFEIESYATVHHLVSTVSGTLLSDKDSIDLLEACFPGGSITGAPKIRAMEIIESLEPQRRGIYCGAIGYIDFNGNMDTNIAIRTLVYNQNTIRYWVGGGIVQDSDINEEYQETFDKGKALLTLLNNFRR